MICVFLTKSWPIDYARSSFAMTQLDKANQMNRRLINRQFELQTMEVEKEKRKKLFPVGLQCIK